MESSNKKLIFILLGPSGSGKTSCGKAAAYDPASGALTEGKVMFLSTGEKLREKEILSPWQEPNMKIVKAFCHKLINETFDAFKASATHRILLLDCVKNLRDAQYITLQAKKYGFDMSRAFVMDVDPTELQERWEKRGEARDIFRGSADSYLNNWCMKFNDVFNYYKRMNMLYSIPGSADLSSLMLSELDKPRQRRIFNDDNPVINCPNNLHFLLVDSVKINDIYTSLLSILNVSWFDFALPASLVHSNQDVVWLTNPTRYHVTLKSNGVRFLLVRIHEETFLINRRNQVYPCLIEGTDLPSNTVLDGELMPSTSMSDISHPDNITRLETNVFMISDVLAMSGQVMWKWPFSERYEILSQLSISKDIVSVLKLASGIVHSSADRKLQPVAEEENGTEKLKVNVVIKEHHQSTPDTIFAYLSSPNLSNILYPYNGLVFTPETPYTFGSDPLLFKWQPEDSTHCNIAYKDLMSGKRRCTGISSFGDGMKYYSECEHYGRIIECEWNHRRGSWNCLFPRHEKVTPDMDETLDHVERTGCLYTQDDLAADIMQITESNGEEGKRSLRIHAPLREEITQSTRTPQNHPTVNYYFDELYSQINELVKLDEVERTIDPSTNLEIFNYYGSSSFDHPIVRICRGLVLHLESKTIVTKPFVRFFEDLGADEPAPQEVVEATVKFDGSLGIAFRWNNEVKVTTRRRMDSEQAMWAKHWIEDHCNTTSFLTGYTYLFEIIYKVNRVIVDYPFQGLVLLAVTDENGHELSYDEVLRYCKIAGFSMVTPRITGPYSEVSWYCGGAVSGNGAASRTDPALFSGALPTMSRQREGWVIKFNDGTRQKIVYNWWKNVSGITRQIHPQIVWLLVKYDKIQAVFGNVPNHIRREIQSMMKAIARQFEETLELADQCLAGTPGKQAQASKMSTKYINEWWVPEISPEELEEESEEESFCLQELFERFTLEGDDSTEPNPNSIKDQVGNNTENNCGHSKDDGEDKEGVQAATNDEETNENSSSLLKLIRKLQPYRRRSKKPSHASQLDHLLHDEINISPFYNASKPNFFRLPILEYIRPSGPAIKGYEPSDNCKQTWSKGWKTLPNDRSELIQQVLQENHQAPVFLQMPIEVILLFLDFLDGSNLAKLSKVCWLLHKVVQSRQSLRKKIAEAKKQHWLDIEIERKNDKIFQSFSSYYSRRSSDYFRRSNDYDDNDGYSS